MLYTCLISCRIILSMMIMARVVPTEVEKKSA